MIGDNVSDMEFARNCKLKGFKINFSDDIMKLLNIIKLMKKIRRELIEHQVLT